MEKSLSNLISITPRRAPTHQDLETEHRQTPTKPLKLQVESASRQGLLHPVPLLLSKEQRSLNTTQVIAVQKDQGSQKNHQFNLLPQQGSNSEVNFLKNLKSLNSGVSIQLRRSYTVHSIFKVSHIISLIIWKLLLHPPLLHYLGLVLKSLNSTERNMNFVLRVYKTT